MRSKSFISQYAIWILIVFFFVWFSLFSILRHMNGQSFLFDLGYYDQLIWQVAHGKPLFSTLLENHPWLDHFSPSIFLLSPIYFFWSSPIVILLTQSVLISLGAYPIYKIGLEKTKNFALSLSIAFSYLMFWGIHNAIAFDFHPLALAAPLLAFMVWFYEQKRYLSFYLAMVVFAGLQENYLIFLAAFGVFLALGYKDYIRGIVITIVASLLFALLIFVAIPHYFGGSYFYLPSGATSSFTPTTLVQNFVNEPEKREVIWFTFAPFAFLPLLSPPHLLLFFEEFAGRFLLNNPNWWGLGYHYNALLATLSTLATIEVVKKFPKKTYRYMSLYLIVAALASYWYIQPDTIKVLQSSFWNLSYGDSIRALVQQIPNDASVAAGNNIGAQLSGRNEVYFISNCLDENSTVRVDSKVCHNKAPDYLVADLSIQSNWNNFVLDYDRNKTLQLFEDKVTRGEYELVSSQNEVYLLKLKKK